MKAGMRGMNGPERLASSPVADVAQILAAGFLRLRFREMTGEPVAAHVSDGELDVFSEKSVHCDCPVR